MPDISRLGVRITTEQHPPPVFRLTAHHNSSPIAAIASITVTAMAVVYTDVRCIARRAIHGASHPCNAWLFALPGLPTFTVTPVASPDARTGHGIAAKCHKCNTLYEIKTDR